MTGMSGGGGGGWWCDVWWCGCGGGDYLIHSSRYLNEIEKDNKIVGGTYTRYTYLYDAVFPRFFFEFFTRCVYSVYKLQTASVL